MSLLNFNDTPRQAFINGFLKGMASPVMLFANFDFPARPEIEPIKFESLSDSELLTSDWNAIGMDFRIVIKMHEQQK